MFTCIAREQTVGQKALRMSSKPNCIAFIIYANSSCGDKSPSQWHVNQAN